MKKLLFERPILVGGLGLAATFSLLSGMHHVLADGTTLATLVAAGVGFWWWKQQSPDEPVLAPKPVTPVARETVLTALQALDTSLETLRQELTGIAAEAAAIVDGLQQRQQELMVALDRTALRVAIAGGARSGKSSLIGHLASHLKTADSPNLILQEVALTSDTPHPKVMAALLQEQDAVIYLVTEDLTESSLSDLKTLAENGQRVLLALNKQDNFLPDDRNRVMEQINTRLQALPHGVQGIAIAAAPKPIKVRTFDAAGIATERLEQPLAEVTPVITVVQAWVTAEVPHLVAQTVMRQTVQLRQDIQQELNQVHRKQAQPIIEQLQWAAAATAFASPVPSLDLLAAIAINGQLVMDLGRVYQQPLALDQAKMVASELAKVVVKLGIVEASMQLLTAALKSHAATYVVGGSVQAFSAAYLTQLSGESLMAYFEERALAGHTESELSVAAIGQQLEGLWTKTQRTEFLQILIKQGMQKLTPPKSAAALPQSTQAVVELPSTPVTVSVTQPETLSSSELA